MGGRQISEAEIYPNTTIEVHRIKKARGREFDPRRGPRAAWSVSVQPTSPKPKTEVCVAPLASPLPARPSHLAVSHRSPHLPPPTRCRAARKNRAARARWLSPKSPSRFGRCRSNFSRARSRDMANGVLAAE